MTKDLEAFKKVGIGGVVFYDQCHGEVAKNSEPAMSPEWWDNVYYSAKEAKRLGLSFEFNISNGFVAGGPWIKPENSMKRVETLETVIRGGRIVHIMLPTPTNKYNYFKDIRIFAIPTADSTTESKVSTNIPDMDAQSFFKKGSLISVPAQQDNESMDIDIEYQTPKTVRSLSYQISPQGKSTTSASNVPAPPQETFTGTGYMVLPPVGELQSSEDGEVYQKVCDIKPLYRAHESYHQKTISFPMVKAKYFRIKLFNQSNGQKKENLRIGSFQLSSDAKINEVEYKAAYISEYIEKSMQSPSYHDNEVIPLSQVMDITNKVDKKGVLNWDAPSGTWKVLRMCMVPTGAGIKHGRPNMMGLECDKMSAAAAKLQFDSYFGRICDSLAAHHLDNLKGVIMDSHEAGSQNWTDDFIEEFKKYRGYNPVPYLPAMSGYVIGNVKLTEGFLYDIRLTIADLVADKYYGTIDHLAKDRHVNFTAQATGNAQCIVAIPIVAKGKVQTPQGEFWTFQSDGMYDTKESSSAAHLYGKNIASAEAFTDGTLNCMPYELKNVADAAYTFGINEFVLCASAHQPDDNKPGNNRGRVYATYTRNNTWFNQSRDFWDYQSRCAYILRQGRPKMDLCLYLGDNAPVRILTHRLPIIPPGYDFDAFTQDALMNRMEIKDGRVTLPSGQSYSMMVLPRSGEITLDALKRIASFVRQGAAVYGNRPTGSPNKKDVGKEEEYQLLVNLLWDHDGYGKGHVYTSMPLATALQKAKILPDVDGPKVYFTHRETTDCDIYFINNHTDKNIDSNYTFKTKYKNAQLWDAMSGKRFTIPAKDGMVKLSIAPRQSFFMVFSNINEKIDTLNCYTQRQTIKGPWKIDFDRKLNGPGEVTLDSLTLWNDNKNPQIKYYSGMASYRSQFDYGADKKNVQLRLPEGKYWADIYVNSQRAGSIWCSPWTVDISNYIKKGRNKIELHVINSWNNRMVGDIDLPLSERTTSDPERFVGHDTPLEPAGIQGKVEIIY